MDQQEKASAGAWPVLFAASLFIFILVMASLNAKGEKTMPSEKKSSAQFEMVTGGMEFPEGPAWDGKDSLYVSNCYGGRITKISPQGAETFVKSSTDPLTFEKTNGQTFDRDGNLYSCEFGRGAIVKFAPDGTCEEYAGGYEGKTFERPNDLAFDREGNLYFTDPHQYNADKPDGIVYRVDRKTKEVTPVVEKMAFPNGLAFSADGKHLYICQSAKHCITRFKVEADGSLSSPENFADLPGGDPDGIAFDLAGNLYVAHFGGGAIIVLAPDGSTLRKIPAPGKKPSNVEFGGPDMKTLFITECETNTVYKMQVETAGLPLFFSPGK